MKQFWVRSLICMTGILTPGLLLNEGAIARLPHRLSTSSATHTVILSQATPDSTSTPPQPNDTDDVVEQPETSSTPLDPANESSANEPSIDGRNSSVGESDEPSDSFDSSDSSAPSTSAASPASPNSPASPASFDSSDVRSPPLSLVVLKPTSFVLQGRKGGYWFSREVPSLRRNLTVQFTNPPDFVKVYVSDFRDPDGDKVYPAEYITCENTATGTSLYEEEVDDVDQKACNPATFFVPESDTLSPNAKETILSLHFHFGLFLKDVICSSQTNVSTETEQPCRKKTLFNRPPSGEFSGEILMITSSGEEVVVPVCVAKQAPQ
ncbi:MAG: hypothetical protein F6K09_19525, partial [Merismopedia sp. SIO2A8]|nr:hypothetical protein [Merismopedia sp. SIO2A8]